MIKLTYSDGAILCKSVSIAVQSGGQISYNLIKPEIRFVKNCTMTYITGGQGVHDSLILVFLSKEVIFITNEHGNL